ncbi:MAG TPA: DUF3187 family protein [Pseudomonadales bacterium]
MSFRVFTTLLLACCGMFADASAPLRNHSPFAQFVGLPGLADPQKLAAGDNRLALVTTLSNQFVLRAKQPDPLLIDVESYISELYWRHGFAGWELEVAVPLISYRRGFMDDLVENFHDLFGMPNANRDKRPRDQLRIDYQGQDNVLLEQPVSGLGDVRLAAGWQLADSWRHRQSLQLMVKLPSGNSERLLGSGSLDVALYSSHRWHPGSWQFDLQYGLLWMQTPDVLANQRRDWAGFGGMAIARPFYWPGWQVMLQLDLHTALYRASNKEPLNEAVMLSGGLRYRTSDWQLQLVLLEDLKVYSAPDVGFMLAMEWFRPFAAPR